MILDCPGKGPESYHREAGGSERGQVTADVEVSRKVGGFQKPDRAQSGPQSPLKEPAPGLDFNPVRPVSEF